MATESSTKNFLIVIHGMGQHTRETVTDEVTNAMAGISGWDEQKVELKVVTYNNVFDDWRERAQEDWNKTLQMLDGRVHFTKMKETLERSLDVGKDDFFQTHWLDVVLYMSTIGDPVQLEVATQLTRFLEEYFAGGNLDGRNCVIVAHSLGTAVAHDSLHKMWAGGFEDEGHNNLSRLPISIDAFFQVANTSRLLKSGIDPSSRKTAVRPAPGALMHRMFNCWHECDPVARIKQFRIKDLDHWLAERETPNSAYKDIRLQGIHQINVHSLGHYLKDPRLHVRLLQSLFDDYRPPQDLQDQIAKHDAGAIDDEIEALKKSVQDAKETFENIESISDIAEAFRKVQHGLDTSYSELVTAIKELGEIA